MKSEINGSDAALQEHPIAPGSTLMFMCDCASLIISVIGIMVMKMDGVCISVLSSCQMVFLIYFWVNKRRSRTEKEG